MKKLIVAAAALAAAAAFADPEIVNQYPGDKCNESGVGKIFGVQYDQSRGVQSYLICVQHIYSCGQQAQYGLENCPDASTCPASIDDKCSSTSTDPGSSTSTTPTSTGSGTGTGTTPTGNDVISTFETGDAGSTTGTYWYAFDDSGDKGASTISNAPDPTYGGYVLYKEADNGTTGMLAMEGISLNKGGNANDPYVALGLDLNKDKSAYAGLSTCTTIKYDYKGAGHNFKAIMAGDDKGGLTGYNRHFKKMPEASSWTTATISWSELQQDNGWGTEVSLTPGNVSGFNLEVKGTASPNYLYMDNFQCVGMTISTPASSASTPTSSASVVPGSSAAAAIHATVNTAAFQVAVRGADLSISVASGSMVQVQVFDMMGHVVKTDVKSLSAGTHSVSLQSLAQGSYMVRVNSGSSMQTVRVNVR